MVVIFKRDHPNVKKPKHLRKNVFILYLSRAVTVEQATCSKIDTNIGLNWYNSNGFVTSKFRGDEIFEVVVETQRLWIEILNKSYIEHIQIKKGSPLGFIVIEPDNLDFKHETTKTKKKKEKAKDSTKNFGLLGEKEKDNEGIFWIGMTSPMFEGT